MASKQLKIDYDRTFNTDHGKRVLEDIMSYCHVLEPVVGDIETNTLLIKQGRRDAALTILEKLNYNERKFIDHVEGT